MKGGAKKAHFGTFFGNYLRYPKKCFGIGLKGISCVFWAEFSYFFEKLAKCSKLAELELNKDQNYQFLKYYATYVSSNSTREKSKTTLRLPQMRGRSPPKIIC